MENKNILVKYSPDLPIRSLLLYIGTYSMQDVCHMNLSGGCIPLG